MSNSKRRRVDSLTQDVVFSATSGKKKPGKHLELGINLKSLTGSRKILDIMNRLGHCANYHTIEEVETSLTLNAKSERRTLPFGLNPFKGSGLGLAWDNFDRFVDTLNGKDTLHDTVGIAFQKYTDEMSSIVEKSVDNGSQSQPGKRKRKRAYETTELEMEPYRKKPKLVENLTSEEKINEVENIREYLLGQKKM